MNFLKQKANFPVLNLLILTLSIFNDQNFSPTYEQYSKNDNKQQQIKFASYIQQQFSQKS